MILEIEKIEVPIGGKYETVEFIRGTTQFESNSQTTSHGIVYECKLRFVTVSCNSALVNRLSNASHYKVTYADGIIEVGSAVLPVEVQLDSVEPAVFIVKHKSLTPYI